MDQFGEQLSFFELSREDGSFLATPSKSRNTEFDMRHASPEDAAGFKESDKSEWKAVIDMGSVKILPPEEAAKIAKQFPHRVITSRMIRRKKPMPGVGNFKFKSRWCVHGHKDPDSHMLKTYSPMLSTEAISMFFQIMCQLVLASLLG